MSGKDFLVIDKDLVKFNQIAFLHELMEYVNHTEQGSSIMKEMESMLNEDSLGWLEEKLSKYESRGSKDYFENSRTHYVIRAFTRQIFDGLDKVLTESIKTKGGMYLGELNKDVERTARENGLAWVRKGDQVHWTPFDEKMEREHAWEMAILSINKSRV